MSPRIFIVDNNHSSRNLISKIVKALGFSNIRAFTDPFEVLSAVETGDFPAVVISDLNMPGLDGVALLNCLSFISCSFSGIIVTSNKKAALDRTDAFPVLDKGSRTLFDQMWDFIRSSLHHSSVR
jgi:CheY-like chemotaxis protein